MLRVATVRLTMQLLHRSRLSTHAPDLTRVHAALTIDFFNCRLALIARGRWSIHMSNQNDRSTSRAPRTERWVQVMAFAFVPVVLAIFLPEPLKIPLVALGALCLVLGFVLMIRTSRASRTEGLRNLVHPGTE